MEKPPAGNSASKPVDGISDGTLNRIMLSQALEALRQASPRMYAVASCRWMGNRWPLYTALEYTGLTARQYYRRCDKIVDFIYHFLNRENYFADILD